MENTKYEVDGIPIALSMYLHTYVYVDRVGVRVCMCVCIHAWLGMYVGRGSRMLQ